MSPKSTLHKILCWVPIVGVFAEAFGQNYLGDPSKSVRYWGSMLWHWVMAIAVTSWVI